MTAQVLPQYEHDALFLALRDDIGVMRDLAAYQDEVVGWLEEWLQGGAQAGANERDYVIACYIESLTQIRAAELPKLADECPAAVRRSRPAATSRAGAIAPGLAGLPQRRAVAEADGPRHAGAAAQTCGATLHQAENGGCRSGLRRTQPGRPDPPEEEPRRKGR
ncbi:hypothetical protein P4200_08590 [Pseudomonas aeruginosa]|nr:hypothetical protein [Pseudomonas aeruginosa]